MNNTHGLIDSHIHLTDYEAGTNTDAIIREASLAGVTGFLCNGTSEMDWPEVLELSNAFSGVIPCFGLHPWFVNRASSDWISVLERLVSTNRCGVGEIGLDKCVDNSDMAEQEQAFRVQLDIARRYNRPAMIHCVRAWGPMLDVLRSEPELPRGFLIHAYGGSADLLKPLSDMGAFFSFSATVLNPNSAKARDALLKVPQDRLLLETDAPNMLPPPAYRTKTVICSDGREFNHPANLPDILGGIAELLNVQAGMLGEQVWDNSRRFLKDLLT